MVPAPDPRLSALALGAVASLAGAGVCGLLALRTHLWLASLGPICGLDRPDAFFRACPACPAGLALLAIGAAFAIAAAPACAPRVRARS